MWGGFSILNQNSESHVLIRSADVGAISGSDQDFTISIKLAFPLHEGSLPGTWRFLVVGNVLSGWKEIAAYLGRGVRTVQRWEVDLGLPVRRPRGKDRSAVISLPPELDEWLAKTPSHVFENESDPENRAELRMAVMVVEDTLQDAHSCVSLLRRLRVTQVDVLSTVSAALRRLEDINDGKLAHPDVMILDLNFPSESGFEVLRLRKMHLSLKKIPVIVWTRTGETEQQLSSVFGVSRVISKRERMNELEKALLKLHQGNSNSKAAKTPE